MNYFILTFLFGCCSVLFFSHVPSLTLIVAMMITSFVLWLIFRFKFVLMLLGFSSGFFWAMFFANTQLHQQLPKVLEGKNLDVIGSITSIPINDLHSSTFNFKTTQLNHLSTQRLIKLAWYDAKIDPQAGQTWRLTVRLKRPRGFMNPGGFDYEAWLFEKKISATGYVVNKMPYQLISSANSSFSILRMREKIQKKVLSAFPNDSLVGFLPALLVGSRQAMTEQQWDVLRNTGTNHLIAIAGLHVGLMSGFVFLLIGFLWRRSSRLTLIYPAKQVALFFSAFIAFIYALMAGFPIQTQRAIIMLFVLLLMSFLKRKLLDWHSWFLALFIVLLLNPLSVMTIGFWMSFIAVASIIFAMRGRIRVSGFWWQWGRVQAVIMIGLLPVSFMIYHEASSVSLIANMIAVPWFAFVVMPLVLLALFFMFFSWHMTHFILWFVLINIHLLWKVLTFLSSHQLSVIKPPNISFVSLGFVAIGGLILLAPRGIVCRKLSLLFFLPLFFLPMKRPEEGEFWFTLLDVGQGLSSFIETKGHQLIYDTGPQFSDHFNAGDAVILPYLSVSGIRKINLLMVSHGDNDHIGGAFALLKGAQINKLLTSVPKRFNESAFYCHAGQSWSWDGVKFKVLWPIQGDYFEDNNSSCVLKVSNGVNSVLLTGDIEKSAEKRIVAQYGNELRSTILVAPHHGSKSSSSKQFIHAVNPKYVLYPVGYRNRFHFPSAIILSRYQSLGVVQLDTVNSGAISFQLAATAQDIFPVRYRLSHHHLWHT